MIAPVEWMNVAGSTIVAAVAYDDAAERIYVRLHSGDVVYFEDCDAALWQRFQSPALSKGEFIKNVLEHHAYSRVPRSNHQ
jgi:hypothetical protein